MQPVSFGLNVSSTVSTFEPRISNPWLLIEFFVRSCV